MEVSPETQQELQDERQAKIREYSKKINTIVMKVVEIFKKEQLHMGECTDVVNTTAKALADSSAMLNINYVSNQIETDEKLKKKSKK